VAVKRCFAMIYRSNAEMIKQKKTRKPVNALAPRAPVPHPTHCSPSMPYPPGPSCLRPLSGGTRGSPLVRERSAIFHLRNLRFVSIPTFAHIALCWVLHRVQCLNKCSRSARDAEGLRGCPVPLRRASPTRPQSHCPRSPRELGTTVV